ncbi:MAG: rRNA maturation RNase YbeY [Bacteroidetes bacterium]|nr:rRNA maturation RNase YbeY [Bacteroidota bacterium]
MKNIKDPISISVFNDSSYQYIPRQKIITKLEQLLFDEKIEDATVNVIVMDNEGIQKINNKFLEHDYPTDVLSFKMEEDIFEAEVYVSVEMAMTNATEYKTNWREELVRYAIHGVLHLLGYNDSTEEEKIIMTKKENKYLSL